jgi:hypothetical protein
MRGSAKLQGRRAANRYPRGTWRGPPRDRIFLLVQPERFDPKRRALEKQRSREADARALASGEKTLEQLERENGHFVFPHVRISFKGSRPLE